MPALAAKKIVSRRRKSISLGLDRLPMSLTINGQTVAPTLIYRGKDATTSSWPARAGEDLALVDSGGTEVVPNQNAADIINGTGQAVQLTPGGDHYNGATGAHGIGTQDLWLSVIYKSNEYVGSNQYFYESNGATPGNFHDFRMIAADMLYFRSIGTATKAMAPTVPTTGNWVFVEVCYNRDEASAHGCTIFANGVQVGGADYSANAADNFGDSNPLVIGGVSAAPVTDVLNGYLALIQQYNASDWFAAGEAGKNQALALHQSRYSTIFG